MTESDKLDSVPVVHNIPAQRFELRIGTAICVLDYRLAGEKMIIYHTEVPESIEGRGLAARLTRAALALARAERLQVEPRCPYTAAFMQKNPEYSDLLRRR